MPLKWGVHGTLETIPRDHRIEHARECPSPFLPNCSANKYCTRYKEAIQAALAEVKGALRGAVEGYARLVPDLLQESECYKTEVLEAGRGTCMLTVFATILR